MVAVAVKLPWPVVKTIGEAASMGTDLEVPSYKTVKVFELVAGKPVSVNVVVHEDVEPVKVKEVDEPVVAEPLCEV